MANRISVQRKIDALEKVAYFIDSIGNLNHLLSEIMRVSEKLLNAQASSVLLYDPKTKELYFEVALGKSGSKIVQKRVKMGQGIAGYAAATGKPVNVGDATRDSHFFKGFDVKTGFKTKSLLAIPLKRKNRLLGVLEILNKKGKKPFDKEDIALAKIIASQAAVAIENAQLYAEKIRTERMAAVGQTIAGLSHDIKNILTGLTGGAELVDTALENENEASLREGWQIAKRGIGKISDLVLDMLNYSREKGPNLQPTNINQIISNAVELYQEKMAQRKGTFRLSLDEQIKLVLLDPAGMERILMNLVSNSLDALPENNGCITIQTNFDREKLLIKVSDNGCGIPPDRLNNIFDIFFTTKGSKGTGLGLAVVQKIIKEHKGKIKVESQTGKGTGFTVTLPYRTP